MYIHLGMNEVVNEKEIVGIFDIDNCSIGKHTRTFFRIAEQQGRVRNVSEDLPKSFILTEKNRENRVYISAISANTLKKRSFLGKQDNAEQ